MKTEVLPIAAFTADQRDQVVTDHLPIVHFLARRMHARLPHHVPIEDLYSAGAVGLLDAFERFDPTRKVLFRSYAQFRIRGAMLDSLRTLDWSPRDLRSKARMIEHATQWLTARLHRLPTEIEVAERMAVPLLAYQQMLGKVNGLGIGPLERRDRGIVKQVDQPAPVEDDPYARLLHKERTKSLADAIDRLSPRERLVMSLYYHDEVTMKEIGFLLQVVESRVSQIHASALKHCRAWIDRVQVVEKS